MEECIFCKIANGEIPCYKLYEDDNYLAFLDIQPFSKGHILVLPKSHYANIAEIPEDLLSGLMPVVKKMAKRINEKLNPEAIFINQNNGVRAGQSVMHFHMHIKPIYKETIFNSEESSRERIENSQLEKLQAVLKED